MDATDNLEMNTAEISMYIDERYYYLEIEHVKAVMRRKLMEEIEKSLKFKFQETESPVPNVRRVIATVEWNPGE